MFLRLSTGGIFLLNQISAKIVRFFSKSFRCLSEILKLSFDLSVDSSMLDFCPHPKGVHPETKGFSPGLLDPKSPKVENLILHSSLCAILSRNRGFQNLYAQIVHTVLKHSGSRFGSARVAAPPKSAFSELLKLFQVRTIFSSIPYFSFFTSGKLSVVIAAGKHIKMLSCGNYQYHITNWVTLNISIALKF